MFNRETHKSRGFGFIVYESERSVDDVCAVKEHFIDGKLVGFFVFPSPICFWRLFRWKWKERCLGRRSLPCRPQALSFSPLPRLPGNPLPYSMVRITYHLWDPGALILTILRTFPWLQTKVPWDPPPPPYHLMLLRSNQDPNLNQERWFQTICLPLTTPTMPPKHLSLMIGALTLSMGSFRSLSMSWTIIFGTMPTLCPNWISTLHTSPSANTTIIIFLLPFTHSSRFSISTQPILTNMATTAILLRLRTIVQSVLHQFLPATELILSRIWLRRPPLISLICFTTIIIANQFINENRPTITPPLLLLGN